MYDTQMTDDEIDKIRQTMKPLAGIEIENLVHSLSETLKDLQQVCIGCNRARWKWIEVTRDEKMMRETMEWPRLEENILARWNESKPPSYTKEELEDFEWDYKNSEQMRQRLHRCIERINSVGSVLSKKKGFWR